MKEFQKQRFGIVVAIELDAIFSFYKNLKELESPAGYNLYYADEKDYELFILRTGLGEIAASAGVQYLIAKWDVSLIVNFGVVGGLREDMKLHKLCVVDRVVHYKYDCSEFMDLVPGQVDGHDSIFLKPDEKLVAYAVSFLDHVMPATCCSGDKFIGTAQEKQYLHDTFEGDICDMESAGIVLSCEMNAVPCLLLKAVSDGLSGGADEFYVELQNASLKSLTALDQILEQLAKAES